MSGETKAGRECPRCGKISVFTIPSGERVRVKCPTCGHVFEVSALVERIKRFHVGGPTAASHSFTYTPPTGVVEFAARLRAYARRFQGA